MRISNGNRKLDKRIGIFNLPTEKTCPGSGFCAKVCYAKKAEKLYPQCLPCREKNYELSMKKGFSKTMAGNIKKMKIGIFRIHESGDFYSQEYLDKWKEIAKMLPEVRFFAYTKSLHLDFSKIPLNLIVIKSFGGRFDWMIDKEKDNHAVILLDGLECPDEYYKCPGKGCGSSCCYCFKNAGQVKVAFHKH